MDLELAVVLSCSPDGCNVQPIDGSPAYETRFSALVQGRVRILPGQLVAVDREPAVPEIAWRWYRVQVVEPGGETVLVQDRERQLTAARVPGLDVTVAPGDEAWVTGFNAAHHWELHDRAVSGLPANPARLRGQVLPRIAEALASRAA